MMKSEMYTYAEDCEDLNQKDFRLLLAYGHICTNPEMPKNGRKTVSCHQIGI